MIDAETRPLNDKEWATMRAASVLAYVKTVEVGSDTKYIQRIYEKGVTITITNMTEEELNKEYD